MFMQPYTDIFFVLGGEFRITSCSEGEFDKHIQNTLFGQAKGNLISTSKIHYLGKRSEPFLIMFIEISTYDATFN